MVRTSLDLDVRLHVVEEKAKGRKCQERHCAKPEAREAVRWKGERTSARKSGLGDEVAADIGLLVFFGRGSSGCVGDAPTGDLPDERMYKPSSKAVDTLRPQKHVGDDDRSQMYRMHDRTVLHARLSERVDWVLVV